MYEVRIESSPTRYPGTCSSCGAASLSPRSWWIDTGCDEKGDLTVNAIIFCNTCFDMLATAAGYVKRGEEVEYYLKRVAELERIEADYESIVSSLSSLGINADSLRTLRGFTMVDSESTEQADSPAGKQTKRGTPKLAEGTDGSSESSDDKNVGKLPSGKSKLNLNLPL